MKGKEKRLSGKKAFALIIGLVLLAAFNLVGTLATPSDYVKVLIDPYIDTAYNLELEVNRTQKTPITQIAFSWDNADDTVLSMETTHSSTYVNVTGLKPGVSSVTAVSKVGQVITYRYKVVDRTNISAYTLKGGLEGAVPGGEGANKLTIPITTEPAGSVGKIVWTSMDTSVATVSDGVVTAQTDDGSVIIEGKFYDPWGREQIIPYLVNVGAGGASTGGGNQYRPVGIPEYVYEVLDKDGNSLASPEYIYNPNETPGDGVNDQPAYKIDGKDGKEDEYYVEVTEDSNIYMQINDDGSLKDTHVVWGGPDNILGTEDDELLLVWHEGSYWLDMGQNVWRELVDADDYTDPSLVDKNGKTLGELTGGGPDRNPATDTERARPIIYHDGKYYLGPIKDDDGIDFYYGDKKVGGNGLLMSTVDEQHGTDDKFYFIDGEMTTETPDAPPKPIVDIPTIADAERILQPGKTGDSVDWIEIARNGDYSLIVRSDRIKINNGGKQTVAFGSNSNYVGSNVRNHIYWWFEGTAIGYNVDKLPENARLRKFTVSNDAVYELGTAVTAGSLDTGISKPNAGAYAAFGADVPFALSYAEAARFISYQYDLNTENNKVPSSEAAKKNHDKLIKYAYPDDGMWLRSKGHDSGHAAAMYTRINDTTENKGRVFEVSVTYMYGNGYIELSLYPALWVHQDIFK